MSPLFQKTSTRRSLVLAGGGVRLAYHAGLLKALEEEQIAFTHIDGTSGGIFNTAMLASGLELAEICERWRHLPTRYFNALLPFYRYLSFWRLPGLASTNGIRHKVFPFLGIDIGKMKEQTAFLPTFNICNFSTKTLESFPASQVTAELLMAGLSLPIFMPSVKLNGDWFTDGVWVKDSNVMEAVKKGAEEIWLVWCIGNTREFYAVSFVQYVHMLEISSAGGLWHELQWLSMVNKLIDQGQSPFGQKKPIVVQVLKPGFPIPLDTDLMVGRIDFRALINMGYADTKQFLKTANSTGISLLDNNPTQMLEPGNSWQCRLQYTGKREGKAISFFALIDVRETEQQGAGIYFTGSYRTGATGQEFPLFEQKATLAEENGRRLLILSGSVLINGILKSVCAKIPLHSFRAFYLGLAFRDCTVQLEDEEPFRLKQSLMKRLSSVWTSHLYCYQSLPARMRARMRLFSYLYTDNLTSSRNLVQ